MKFARMIAAASLLAAGLFLSPATYAADKPALPRLVDLGADKCIPCKMMASVLDNLKTTCAGKLEVQFIDVWKHKAEAESYGIKMIPTQIFYSPDGKELYRHQGFFAGEDILAKWRTLGYDFGK